MAQRKRTAAEKSGEQAPLVARVFAELADGKFHSGEDLARSLGVTRSAVWKAVGTLKDLGATLQAVRNRGYRLAQSGEAFDAARIRASLPPTLRARVTQLRTVWSIDSTNSALLARPDPAPGNTEVLLAEYQTAGRGRRGRAWLAPPGGGLCLSLSWTFPDVPPELAGLSLAIGVCVLRALKDLGLTEVGLKWPNDLLLGYRKLGGILIELRAESAGPACVVIGIGLNVSLGARFTQEIAAAGLPPSDLATAGLPHGSRNQLAAHLIRSCVAGLEEFARTGLMPFLEEWKAADALAGKMVNVSSPQGKTGGLAHGVDVHGALLLETQEGVQRFVSGEVSLRPEG